MLTDSLELDELVLVLSELDELEVLTDSELDDDDVLTDSLELDDDVLRLDELEEVLTDSLEEDELTLVELDDELILPVAW